MKRLFAAIIFFVCTAFSVNAQSTVVSGTVTDTAAQTWNNGTFTFQLVANPRFPNLAQYTWTGGKLNQTIGGSLDGAGAYSQSVPSNSAISPQGSTWQLKVCPLATASCSLTADITITGATQILNTTPPAIAINLLNPDQFITAYSDSEIITAFIGGQYYNLTTQLMRDCTTVVGQACTVWVNVGASGALLFIGVPTGPCLASQTAVDTVTGNFYNCLAGVWHLVGPGTGTLTSPVTSPNPFAFDVNLAFKGPNPYVDVTRFGVRAIPASGAPATPGLTASCTSGLPAVTISSASIFINGDGVVLYGCGPGTIGVPAAPTVTPSLLAGQTGMLLDVNGPVGATTYCYQLVARSLMGATNVSPETCTATGPASLGLQTNTITTIALANNVATFTTSAPHGLVVGAHVVNIGSSVNTVNGQANGTSSFNPFDGWFAVATVPDNTHFTVNLYSDTRNGAVTSGTGGTLSYWNSIHITATETTGNYIYYIYGRVTGGTKTLIGAMWPQDVNLVVGAFPSRFSDVTYLAFDDLGSTVTTLPNKPFFLPTTVPTVPTNDMLATTIVSGAGTTSLVLANNAGNTISGQTILFDDAITTIAAANYAMTAPNAGQLMIPEVGSSANSIGYVFNSPITLPQGLSLIQKGFIRLNEPVTINSVNWKGETSATSVSPTFANGRAPNIQFNTCSPCIFATHASFFENLNWQMLSGNGAVGFMQESGGIPDAGTFNKVKMSAGTGIVYSNMLMVFRGNGAGYVFDDNSLTGNQNGNVIATTPGIYFDIAGNATFTNLNLSGIGIAMRPYSAGAWLVLKNIYSQGNYQPFVGVAAASTDARSEVTISAVNIGFDTTQLPLVANYGGHSVRMDAVSLSTSTNDPVITGSAGVANAFSGLGLSISGASGGTKSPTNVGSSFVGGGNAFDGTFGRVGLPIDTLNRSQALGPGFSLFSYTAPPPAMTSCAVSAGGSVPVGATYYFYVPIYPNGSEGAVSLFCLATTSGGNQTVTLNWTAIPGVTQYNVYRGINQTSANTSLLNCSPITGTTLVDTVASNCGGSMSLNPAGGPAGLRGELAWANTVQVGGILVGALPAAAAANAGQIRRVTDSTAIAAEGQVCVGGGAVIALAFSTGAAWKCF